MVPENQFYTHLVSINRRDHKLYKKAGGKLFRKIIKTFLSHITFYLEDDDRKPVDFNNETTSFTRALIIILKIIGLNHD